MPAKKSHQTESAKESSKIKTGTGPLAKGDSEESRSTSASSKKSKTTISDEDLTQMSTLLQDLEDLSLVLKEQRETIEEQDIIIDHLSRRARKLENKTGPPSQLIWRIDDFDTIMKKAKNEKQTVIYSPPFYTHHKGYKIGLSLCPNGDGSGQGTHMSIFFCLLWTSYDALLPWPYSLPIEFRVLDQREDASKRKHLGANFTPNPVEDNMTYLGRPETFRNPSVGLPKFAAHETLYGGEYIVDNTMFIQCKVDISSVSLL